MFFFAQLSELTVQLVKAVCACVCTCVC